jgi:hypothetical protein
MGIFGLSQKQINANFEAKTKSEHFFFRNKKELFEQYNRKYIGSLYATCIDKGVYQYTELIIEEVHKLKRIALYFDLQYSYPYGCIYITDDFDLCIKLSCENVTEPYTIDIKRIKRVNILLKSDDINIHEFNQLLSQLIEKRSILNIKLENSAKKGEIK